jgi:hypothetical protein
MAQAKTNKQRKQNYGANAACEAELWQMTDELRGNKRWTVIYHSGMPTVEINKRWLFH